MFTRMRHVKRRAFNWPVCLLSLWVALLVTVLSVPVAALSDSVGMCKLAGPTGFHIDHRVYQPAVGTVKGVMIFVDFPNARIDQAPPQWRSTQPYYDYLVPEAAKWFENASYGRVTFEVTVIDKWYTMSQPDHAYGFTRGIPRAQHVAYIREAVGLAEADVDFSQYDTVLIVPARNASAITFSPTYIDHRSGEVRASGTVIRSAVTYGQDVWHWGYKVVNHETGHVFGLPDLYAFSGSDAHRFVGGWDVMGLISGHAPDYFAWNKWRLGWVDDDQVVCITAAGVTEHVLTAVEIPGGTKLVMIPIGNNSAYAIESRKPLVNDEGLCSPGVLIYRVNAGTHTGQGPIEVVDATPQGTPGHRCGRNIDVATFGLGPGTTAVFSDPVHGITVEVIEQTETTDRIRVTLGR